MRSNSAKLKKGQPPPGQRAAADSVHWLFRSNIPRRRGSPLPADMRKRNFFGMGDIIEVILNPKDTIRSLMESRRELEEARQELSQSRECSQPLVKPKLSPISGFCPRPEEQSAVARILDGESAFTIVFGSSLVGKTVLLRETLSSDKYHVMHFDLRMPGFADVPSLYLALSRDMERFFADLAMTAGGYKAFEADVWNFKRDRFNVEQRAAEKSTDACKITTSDIARLMEMFRSSLLKYSQFQPDDDGSMHGSDASDESSGTREDKGLKSQGAAHKDVKSSKVRWRFLLSRKGSDRGREIIARVEGGDSEKRETPPSKKILVLLFDEAHKLPALVQSTEAMKCLLDSMLVLTKQDRLCHVVHATSDPFYQTTLRQWGVMQHCKTLTFGDCSKPETREFFRDRLLPRVPDRLHTGLDFETLYDAFGGKLAHWCDYITDYVNAKGNSDVRRSSHFLQAHSFLNLHIIHSSQSHTPTPGGVEEQQQPVANQSTDAFHPALGPAGLKPQSPTSPTQVIFNPREKEDRAMAMVAGYYEADFTAMQLLKVMSRLTQPEKAYLPYFLLCREIGVCAVDGMVRAKVLELRWTEVLTKEGVEERTDLVRRTGISSRTLVESMGLVADEDVWAYEQGQGQGQEMMGVRDLDEEELDEIVVGPKLVPISPIMRYAMREVVQEYEDEQSVSEYASLSDVDEY